MIATAMIALMITAWICYEMYHAQKVDKNDNPIGRWSYDDEEITNGQDYF